MTVYNMLNVDERPKNYETSDGISMTVPDQTMDMREILARFVNGQELPIGNGLEYMEDDEIESSTGQNIKSLDLTEQHGIKDYYRRKSQNQTDKTNVSLDQNNEVETESPESQTNVVPET